MSSGVAVTCVGSCSRTFDGTLLLHLGVYPGLLVAILENSEHRSFFGDLALLRVQCNEDTEVYISLISKRHIPLFRAACEACCSQFLGGSIPGYLGGAMERKCTPREVGSTRRRTQNMGADF